RDARGDWMITAGALAYSGGLYAMLGEIDRARELVDRSLAVVEEFNVLNVYQRSSAATSSSSPAILQPPRNGSGRQGRGSTGSRSGGAWGSNWMRPSRAHCVSKSASRRLNG